MQNQEIINKKYNELVHDYNGICDELDDLQEKTDILKDENSNLTIEVVALKEIIQKREDEITRNELQKKNDLSELQEKTQLECIQNKTTNEHGVNENESLVQINLENTVLDKTDNLNDLHEEYDVYIQQIENDINKVEVVLIELIHGSKLSMKSMSKSILELSYLNEQVTFHKDIVQKKETDNKMLLCENEHLNIENKNYDTCIRFCEDAIGKFTIAWEQLKHTADENAKELCDLHTFKLQKQKIEIGQAEIEKLQENYKTEIVHLNNIIAQQKREIHYTLQTMNNVLDSKGVNTPENCNDEVYRLLLTYKSIKCDEITNLEQERIKKISTNYQKKSTILI